MNSDAVVCGSDQDLHCLPKSKKKCLWTDPLDKIIWKLRGVKFVLFVVSLQKFLYFGKQC